MSFAKYRKFDELWLIDIPEHWNGRKIKYTFSERVEKGYPNEPLLVASQNMGVVPKDVYGARTVEATKDLQNLKLVRVGDFVVSLRSFQGGLEYAYYQGIISPAYTVMNPNEHIAVGYFRYLAKSQPFLELLQMCVTGIREGQNIDYGRLKNHHIPIPPPYEQDQIVRYLDWKVSQINKLINAKKWQINLLNEFIGAKIDDVFRSATDRATSLSRCTTKIGSGKTPRGGVAVYVEIGIMFIRSQNVYPSGIVTDTAYYITDEIDESMKSTRVYKGDVLLNITGGSLGRSCVYDLEEHANVNQHVCIIRPNQDLLVPEYLAFFLNSPFGQEVMTSSQNEGNRESLTFVQIGSFKIPLPTVEVQKQILTLVNSITKPLEAIIKQLNDENSYLAEYRTRLISDVVTGKLDVQNVTVPEYEVEEEVADVTEDVHGMEADE